MSQMMEAASCIMSELIRLDEGCSGSQEDLEFRGFVCVCERCGAAYAFRTPNRKPEQAITYLRANMPDWEWSSISLYLTQCPRCPSKVEAQEWPIT